MKELIKKYNIQGPRYTSYPPVPYWSRKPSQAEWLNEINASLERSPSMDLYIHIPYCEKLCYYCGCNRVVSKDKSTGIEYVNSLIAEWDLYCSSIDHPFKINSIHLGGGTPTFLPAEVLNKLLNVFVDHLADDFTGSIEIDPRTVTSDHLRVISNYRFNRLSLGIQDFDEEVQSQINRHQPYSMIESLVKKIRSTGDFHLNFDLIYGLPKQTINTISETLKKVTTLSPDSIAFYSYAHLPHSIPNQRLIKDEHLPSAELKLEMLLFAQQNLTEYGYKDIGMDHFALSSSFLSNKNLTRNFMGYTDKKSPLLIGLGASSIGQSQSMFIQNSKKVAEYSDFIRENQLPLIGGHILNEQEVKFSDYIQDVFCSGELRLEENILKDDVTKGNLRQLEEDGLISIEGPGHLKITHLGKKFLRNIAMAIDPLMKSSTEKLFSKTV